MPFRGEACAECELSYHEDKERLRLGAWFAAGFAVPWAALAAISDALPSWSARSGGYRAITTGVPMLDVLIMTMVIAVFAGKGAMGLRTALHRRSFMAPARMPVATTVRPGRAIAKS